MGFFTRTNFERTLQGWICLIGLMALGNTLTCFVTPAFIADRLYTGAPDKANDLAARLFGMWTLVAALLRIVCAFCIDNRPLYHLTYISFFLALLHFLSELFYYKTTVFGVGFISPLIASSLSILFMTIGYCCGLGTSPSSSSRRPVISEDNMPRRVEDIRLPAAMAAANKSKRSKKD